MTEASADDVARAAQLVAAVSAGDEGQVCQVIAAAQGDGGMVGLVIALAVRQVQIAGEFYDTDRQQILDMYAMDAIAYLEESE